MDKNKKREAVIVAYGRSACCRAKKGGLANTHPVEYSAQVLRGVLNRVPQLEDDQIDDVVMGCAIPEKQMGFNIARQVARRAGLPKNVPGQTINRFCSSGLQAIATGANAILAGQMDCVIAGGTEDMSHCYAPLHPVEYQDAELSEEDPGTYMGMGETAERVADVYNITREQMDAMAVESHQKAAKAQKEGKLAPSIIPVVNAEGVTLTEDEGIRPNSNMEKLATLKPAFRPDGRVTAGNSSQLTDACAFVIVMASDKAEKLGITPLARFVGFTVIGCEASLMGLGPIYAVPKIMKKTGLTLSDMDVIELNEAFAAQEIACIQELQLPKEKLNPYGGAMALGHPMGATGAILTGKALDYLQDTKGRYALITMCIGGGMGGAGIFEKI